MKILESWDRENNPIPPDQIKKDMEELESQYEQALKDIPTWNMFGGIIIQDRSYHVN